MLKSSVRSVDVFCNERRSDGHKSKESFFFDGTPYEVKVSCTVWAGGKDGDNIKILPISIGLVNDVQIIW